MSDYLVLGAGNQGLALAAHLALCGETVRLWNRTPSHIQEVVRDRLIHCTGVVNGVAQIAAVSAEIDAVVADVMFIAAPTNAHNDIGRLLAPRVRDETIIVLSPGRTFGALHFQKQLQLRGCCYSPAIFETQTVVHTCRRTAPNAVHIIALKHDVLIAGINGSRDNLMPDALPECLRNRFKVADSFLKTSLGNVGMILHCAPTLMNIGAIECGRICMKYYFDGISQSVGRFLEKMDMERLRVGERLGVTLETTAEWMRRTYGAHGDSLYECIRTNEFYQNIDAPSTIHHRYLYEDVPNGLAALEYLAASIGVTVPRTSLVIDLACEVMDRDFRAMARKISGSDIVGAMNGSREPQLSPFVPSA